MSLCLLLCLSGCDNRSGARQLEGAWKFKTERYSAPNSPNSNHILSGNLIVGEMVNGERSCNLSVTHRSESPNFYRSNEYVQDTVFADQKCTISINDNAVTIISEIIKSSSENYFPDNFELRMNENRMTGKLISNIDVPVTFVKSGEDGGLLPQTLWDSERAAALQELGEAEFLSIDTDGCVNGISDIEKSKDNWRKAEIVHICDGEYNGRTVRSSEIHHNIDCESKSIFYVSRRFNGPRNKFVDYGAEVFGEDLLKFGPYGIESSFGKLGSVYKTYVEKACA